MKVYPNKEYLKRFFARMEEIGWKERRLEVLNEVEGLKVNGGAETA